MAASLNEIVSEVSNTQHVHVELKSLLFEGNSHVVYELLTGDNKRWCLRMPVNNGAARLAFRGSKILKALIVKRPALRALAVILSTERYTVLEFLTGHALGSWSKTLLPKERRQVLLDHLADFLYSLWGADLDIPNESGHTSSYLDWLRNEVDLGLQRTLKGTSSWGTCNPIHFLQCRAMINEMLPVADDGLVAIKHGDMNAWNVIITESGLSGVIDWDTSQVVPAASAIQHPLFIADIPGWNNDGVAEEMTFEDDRAYLEHAIRKLEGDSGAIATLLETSRERQFFESSLRNRRIHHAYVEPRLSGFLQKDSLLNELENLLTRHGSMRNHSNVLCVRAELAGEKDI